VTGSADKLLRVIELGYDAATDRARWPALLRELATTFRCELVVFDIQDSRAQWARVQCSVGPDDAGLQREYETYYSSRNIFLSTRPDLTYSGAIRNGEAIVPDREAVKSEYFNDFLRRVGVLHAIGMVPFREGPVMALMSLMRRIGAPSFSATDIAFLERFMPHLQRAALIQRRLRGVDLERDAASQAIDRLPYGVIMLDETGSVIFGNMAGEELLAEADGLRILDGRLSAMRPRDAEALRKAVAEALHLSGAVTEITSGFIEIARQSGRRPYTLMVAPLRLEASPLTSKRPAVIVFVTDPDRTTVGIQAILRRLYGLTQSEAEVTQRLLQGCALREIGEELGTSVNTTRTHLKRVLAKTGARSQSELVGLLLRSPAELRAGNARVRG
jgi:DNA-binding CsgD family transcriptional regulator/PAS domain-containing protein